MAGAGYGWMGNILYVDLTSGKIKKRDTWNYVPDYLGGRALASRIAWDEIPAGIDAMDPENRIIVTTGPLTGTLAPTSGRTVMAGVSPRSYPVNWYTHSTLGGWFGPELKYAGFDAIVVSGRSNSAVYLEILDEKVRLVNASPLWGMDTRQTQLAIKKHLGSKTQVLTIGPAGENLVRFATVQHSEENAAGHSGFGAVWGSKNLKAIAVRGSRGVPVHNPAALLNELVDAGTGKITPAAAVTFGNFETQPGDNAPGEDGKESTPPPAAGEPVRVRPACSQACSFNCILGAHARNSDGRLVPGFCIGAVWQGGSLMEGTKYNGGDVTVPAGVNFELQREVDLHELCNLLGIDLWFRLVMQPWFVRCRELGIDHIRGHEILPGDPRWFEEFVYQLARREGLGDLFAEDLRRAVDDLEEELPPELIRLGKELEFGFGFPAHREGRFWDEEPLPFWVISAMMYFSESRDPTIGSHLSTLLHAEFFLADGDLSRRQFRRLSEKVFEFPDAFEPTFHNKAPVAIWSQNQHMLIDSLTLCDFAFPQLVRPFSSRSDWESSEDISGDLDLARRLLAAVSGLDLDDEHLTRIAERAFTLERMMLARVGRGRKLEESLAPHFKLPCRADGTQIEIDGFRQLMDEYLAARDWDLETGWPTAGALRRIGLDEFLPELEEIYRLTQEIQYTTSGEEV